MLDDAPDLLPEAAYYLNAFDYLSTSRRRGDAVQPITITEITSFCELVKEHDPWEFLTFIKPLDRLFIDFYDESDS